jgi:ribonuclease H / adenosylcobalamin/alpha-ribazole phosphatase
MWAGQMSERAEQAERADTSVARWTRFVLVRHGEAAGNRELRYLGATDAPLTERGREQARQLADALRAYPLAAISSSPLTRARETANAIAAPHGLDVLAEEDLREGHFGAWENRTRAEVRETHGAALAAWEAGTDVAPPGGESLEAVRARTLTSATRLAARHAGEMVALVSHVGPIKALVCAALGLPAAGALRMWLDPASICVVDWRAEVDGTATGLLRVFNATAHLDPPPRWLAK